MTGSSARSGRSTGSLRRRYTALVASVVTLTVIGVHLALLLGGWSHSNSFALASDGAAVLIGGLLGVILAFGWDRYAERLRSVADIEEVTGLPVLESIPMRRIAADQDLVAARTGRPVEVDRAYRKLGARLDESWVEPSAQCLLVTSPQRRDGRTVAANLAASVAADGSMVALVAADPRGEARLNRLVGTRPSDATTNLDGTDDSLESMLCPTGIERLSIVPTSTICAHDDRGYGDELARLLDRLVKHVDLVVIDGPPLLAGPDAALLAQDADRVVLEVDRRHARRADTSQGLAHLGPFEGKVIGSVATSSGGRWARTFGGAVGAASTSSPRKPRSAQTSTARGNGFWSEWGTRRRWLPAVLVTAGLMLTVLWWPGAGSFSEILRDDAQSAGQSPAGETTADVSASLQACRSAWDAQDPALDAAAGSMKQWKVHIKAMNQLVAGKISLEQANKFWEQTRVHAATKVRRFLNAEREYRSTDESCTASGHASGAAAAQISDCKNGIAARDEAIRAAQVAIGTWHHHVMDMNMLRDGVLAPDDALRMWRKSWKKGIQELNHYRHQLRQAAPGSC